ncbi:kelch-like protein 17 [Octopus bimaculoides]|uniref:BTB domain-containing protein n=1 Tax=Octopus bimaculoides TaxID=37653 RepID=A0A0L8G0A5_OCTBM|nr:kelch-like protein 17 [Octopus bimaculoides]|eukprot:XP_014785275.1 PREDICTED: kelch-like protein 17 [Octopus bimaculoides]
MLVARDEFQSSCCCTEYPQDSIPLDLSASSQNNQNAQTCEIVVSDGAKFTLDCHALSRHSGYFRWLFKDSYPNNRSPITLDNINRTEFQRILDYINTGSIDLDMVNIENVLQTCQYLLLTQLTGYCEQFLLTKLDTHWLQILGLTGEFCLLLVGPALLDFLMKKFETISKDVDRFNRIPFEVLFSLAQSPQLKVPSEFFLFKQIVKWINYDFEARADCFDHFMTVVRLPVMSRDELEEVAMHFNPCVYTPALHMLHFLLNNSQQT